VRYSGRNVKLTTHLSLKDDTVISICKYSGEAEVQFNTFTPAAVQLGGWSVLGPGRFTPGKNPVHNVLEAGWVPGLI
jgi:hypothetical protein